MTSFTSASAALDEVWELAKYTLRVGLMDVNTDSNTRQRDNCNLDSALQAQGQAVIAPAAALRYLRRNSRFLNEPDANVHGWSEFALSTLSAVYDYTRVSGDSSVAAAFLLGLLLAAPGDEESDAPPTGRLRGGERTSRSPGILCAIPRTGMRLLCK